MTNYIAYYRVSTKGQGQSGLGLEAQVLAVNSFLNGSKLITSFFEVESGKKTNRPILLLALAACRIHKATLVVAKLDRLARDAHFLLSLAKEGVDFVACDLPSANRLTVSIMAMVAEEEARLISVRTKSALAAAKARGTILGNPKNLTHEGCLNGAKKSSIVRTALSKQRINDLAPIIKDIQFSGVTSLRGIAFALSARGISAPRGGQWHPGQVLRILNAISDNQRIPTSTAV